MSGDEITRIEDNGVTVLVRLGSDQDAMDALSEVERDAGLVIADLEREIDVARADNQSLRMALFSAAGMAALGWGYIIIAAAWRLLR